MFDVLFNKRILTPNKTTNLWFTVKYSSDGPLMWRGVTFVCQEKGSDEVYSRVGGVT